MKSRGFLVCLALVLAAFITLGACTQAPSLTPITSAKPALSTVVAPSTTVPTTPSAKPTPSTIVAPSTTVIPTTSAPQVPNLSSTVSAGSKVTVSSPILSIKLGTAERECVATDPTVITFETDTSNPAFMIAPNRAGMDALKYWHFLQITANKTWKLEVSGADVTGDIIAKGALRYWYSGTYCGYSTDPLPTTPESTANGGGNKWDDNIVKVSDSLVCSYSKELVGGKSYMSYQLDRSILSPGPYQVTITYKVTSGWGEMDKVDTTVK